MNSRVVKDMEKVGSVEWMEDRALPASPDRRTFVKGMAAIGVGSAASRLFLDTAQASAQESGGVAFEGEKTDWHGFDRYDYIMDEQTLAIVPFKAPAGEGTGVANPPNGQRRCIVVAPKKTIVGNPWSWRGVYWDHQPQTEIELLSRGFHVAYVSANATLKPGKEWDAWYSFLTARKGLSPKPAFIGMSRGGEYSYTWATANAEKVSCIYADNPGMNHGALLRLGELAWAGVPVLHVCGSIDPLLGRNSTAIEEMYRQFGGEISVMIKEGFGHHPHSFRDPKPIAGFIEQSVFRTPAAAPVFAGTSFSRSYFYSNECFYRNAPEQGAYLTCRGPLFTPSYERYEFPLDHVEGTVTVIVPRSAASGLPWVFRSGFVFPEAKVDLALLAKGFHIVTGPVGYNFDGPVIAHWNTVYEHLVAQGFSSRPVMEGAGAAAGEVYAWAIANPEKVACIYAENPILHSNLAKVQPLDSVAALASAHVPLLHVCGSRDPHFAANTQVLESRYKKLGGRIRVILENGREHYPLAPDDPAPAIGFIEDASRRA